MNSINKTLWLLFSSTILSASSFHVSIPQESSQLLEVVTEHKNSSHGILTVYERSNSIWKRSFKPITVVVGSNGLGQGLGINDVSFEGYELKREGDKRAPAGLFKLPSIFGYSNASPNSNMPYISAKNMHCVDDVNSSLYTKIIPMQKGYESFENMLRDDDIYKYGIVVAHNSKAKVGRGSCIFIHIARKEFLPTLGCTAMKEEDLLKIIKWLDERKNPLLLQYSKEEQKK